jgi:hypothetical protein
MIVSCVGCGTEVNRNPSKAARRQAHFCSRACLYRFNRRAQVSATCKRCGVGFSRAASGFDGNDTYCSHRCWFADRGVSVSVVCAYCRNPFNLKASAAKRRVKHHCSRACRNASAAGRDRSSGRYKNWRNAVFARDEFKCRDCGSRNNLHAHHIKTWLEHPDFRFELSNGLTLCFACHQKKHPFKLTKKRMRKLLGQKDLRFDFVSDAVCSESISLESHAKLDNAEVGNFMPHIGYIEETIRLN